MDSLFQMGAKPFGLDTPTMNLHKSLDRSDIALKLKDLCKREATQGCGPERRFPLAKFKLMVLGLCDGLSDSQLQHAQMARLDFMVFTGF